MTEEVAKGKGGRPGVRTLVVGTIILAALAFILINALGDIAPEKVDTATGKNFTCTVLSVLDGDGPINCKEQDLQGKQVSVRLRGIDARDAGNNCSHPGLCPQASMEQGKAALEALAVGRLECVSFGPSYNRVDSSCRNAKGQDLSCEMVRGGTAVRWPEYDPEGRLTPCVPRPQ